jgi:hypothetical protein
MIIIDGLHEITDPEERCKFLKSLASLNTPADGSMKAINTSGDGIDIRQLFSEFEVISIAALGNDLELFVAML